MDMQNKKARDYWKNFSKNKFPDPFDSSNKARATEWNKLYNSFNIKPSSHPNLIELGCGTGHFTLNFLKKGFRVTGIDAVSDVLEILKVRARKYGLSKNLSILCDDLHEPLDLNRKFDAGYMVSTYHCISNKRKEQKKVLKNFVNLLKPGGKLMIMEPNPLNILYYINYPFAYGNNWREGYNIINSRKELLICNLKSLGMEDVHVFYHSFLPTFLINKWIFVKEINEFLCKIPGVRNFSAFNIITAVKK